jgi:transcription-repair coupling factor (superfamily II helicase)
VQDETSVSLNLGVDVAIPDDYINDMGQRLRTYKRIASARDDEALRQIRAEMEDRYGRVPESVENLLAYARLRRAAEQTGAISIDRTPQGIAIKLSEKARVAPDKLLALVRGAAGAAFSPNGVLRVELNEDEQARLIETAHGLLLQIRAAD